MRPLLFLLAIALASPCTAQVAAIAADKMNLAYVGVDNPLTIVSGACGCNELVVSVDQGEIRKSGDCKYIFHASKEGRTIINISRRKGSGLQKLGERTMRVKFIPDPVAGVGNRKSGLYPVAAFREQTGISLETEGLEMDMRMMISRFSIEVIRAGGLLFRHDVHGTHFDPECRSFFSRLRPGDQVRIYGIKCVTPDSLERSLADLLFTMN